MTDYTAAEVEAALEPILEDEGWYLFADSCFEDQAIVLRGETVPVTRVDGESGGEGSAEDAPFAVIKVGDQLFEKTGYYMSHDGTTWDGELTEVVARQATVTVYDAR